MKRMISVVLLAVGCLIWIGGCTLVVRDRPGPVYAPPPPEPGPPPWAPAHGHRAKYRYYYYPEPRVYFDVGRGLYFYYSGGAWQVSVSLPAGIYIRAEEYVTLEMDADRPYVYHSEVEKRYPPGHFKKKGKGKGKGKDWD